MEEFTSFLPLAVGVVSQEGVVVDTNEAFTQFTGYENSEAVGNPLSYFFVETDTLDNILTSLNESPGTERQAKLTLKTGSGSEKTVRVTIGIRHDIDGKMSGYFIGISNVFESNPPPAPKPIDKTLDEISEEQPEEAEPSEDNVEDAAESVIDQQDKNRAIIDGVRDGILVIDNEGVFDLINQRATEMLSLERDELSGKPLETLSDREELAPLVTQINSEDDETTKMELGEDTFEVSVHSATVDDSVYRIVTLHDISRDQFIEDMKLTFVSVAAHQIRTPLSSIRWSLEILANQLEDEEQKEVARRGYRSTQNILEIVNGLLNLDRLQSGEDQYEFEPVDVIEVIEGYVDEVRDHNKILEQPEIIFETPMDPLPKVRADRDKLRIVFRNLIDNALKYTDSDGSVTIETSVHVTDDYGNDIVEVSVADTGIGIPAEAQEKIFSKFYRADNATSMETDGSGIGLYITKQIVDEHDGTIWFESAEGEGTTFFVRLPMSQTQD